MSPPTAAIGLLVAGLLLAGAGAIQIVGQQTQGFQPWDPLLADNVAFAKSLPFAIGLGILVGLIRATLHRGVLAERRADGAIRRFSWGTVLTHWLNALGFVIALTTGSLQYLRGVLDSPMPLPLDLTYRLHYVGASLVLFAAFSFIVHRALIGDQRLLPSRQGFSEQLHGLRAELPRWLGDLLARVSRLRPGQPPPEAGQFKYYERVVSFPIWGVLLAVILVTGIVKAIRYIYPVPGPVLWWASFFHVAAMVLLAAKFLDHLRYVLAASRQPMLTSMFTTWMNARYAREHHPQWYHQVMDAPQDTPVAAPAPKTAEGPAGD